MDHVARTATRSCQTGQSTGFVLIVKIPCKRTNGNGLMSSQRLTVQLLLSSELLYSVWSDQSFSLLF